MTGQIFQRKLTVKSSRFGSGVTGGAWWKLRWRTRRSLPSYISAKSISEAVIDLLVPDAAGKTTMSTIQDGLDRLPEDVVLAPALEHHLLQGGERRARVYWFGGRGHRDAGF